MAYARKVKLNIETIVALDMPDVHKYKSASGFNIDCPFCGRKNKLNINTTKNVWACPACGECGGFLVLHSKLNGHNEDKKWAIKDLKKRLATLDNHAIETTVSSIDTLVNKETGSKAFDLQMRSKVFKNFLKHLPISEEFEKELASDKRGNISKELALKLGYRSFSDVVKNTKYGKVNVAELAMIEAYGMESPNPKDTPSVYAEFFKRTGSKVPGFTVKDNHIIAQEATGCDFLPVRSRHGEISFLQTKYPALKENATPEEKASYKKYGRYMSYGEKGCSTAGLECIHYTYKFDYNSDTTPKEVWLTEGILKADIAATMANKPFIALVGITAHSQLPKELEYLKAHGTKKIVVAIDMDYINNKSVANACKKIISMIKKAGLECDMATWNKEYKGIDDFLITANKGKANLSLNIQEM